jgi:hypothetical protein
MDVTIGRLVRGLTLACLSVVIGSACLGACSTGDPASPRFEPVVTPEVEDAGNANAAAALVYMSCPDAGYPACPSPAPSWKAQVQAIVDTYCAPCHFNGGAGTGNGYVYSTSEGLRHGLTTALTDVHRCVMPPSPAPPLPPADWHTLLEWLACGAPNN